MIFSFPRSRTHRIVAVLVAAFVLLLGIALTSVAQAQSVQTYTFVYLVGADTVGVETVTPGADAMRGVLRMRAQPRIEWDQYHQNQKPGRLAMRVFAVNAAADAPPMQRFGFVVRGDSADAEQTVNGESRTQVLAIKPGTVALMGNSVLHGSLIAQYARSIRAASLPVFVTSGARMMDAAVSWSGDTSTLTVANLPIRTVWRDGVPLEITIAAQGLRVVRTTGPVGAGAAVAKPVDYSAPAGAPYTAEHVKIPSGRGYDLAATLTRPVQSARTPVLITISGSGPQERDGRISLVPNYEIFRQIADTLGRRGIAVLRFDDRGVGESGGQNSVATATSADFADDVRSIVAWLRTRSDIDGSRIALAGHSEGGMIAPMVAASDPTIKAIALLAGPAYDGRRILMFQNRLAVDNAPGLTSVQRDSLWKTVPSALDSLAKSNPWMGFFMTHDPIATIKRVKQPVLILQGLTDQQVTPEQADSLTTALRTAGNRTVTTHKFPAVNHLFLNDPSGMAPGYSQLKDVRVPTSVLGILADWTVRVLR